MMLLSFIVFLTCRTVVSLNILFIVVDDLRPALSSYGDERAYTPNIDTLAENGVLFSHAYAQQALCAPSRNSLLTGRRPDTLRLYDFYSYWRESVGNFTTLPQHLKNHGYRTKSIGKVFHPGITSNRSDDSPYSWTDVPFHPRTNRYKDSPVCSPSGDEDSTPAANLAGATENFLKRICPVSIASMPERTLPDLEILGAARTFMRNQTCDPRPFFLAVGFEKPHIPLKYPREYLKYHPLSKFKVIDPYEWPGNVSDVAYNPWTDIRRRDDVRKLRLKFPWEKIPEDFASRIMQSYYAAVTYVDDLVGALLDELRTSAFRDNTAVVFTSDHGWSLGEHAEWAKYSNFEVALRVPLIITLPHTGPDVTVVNLGRSGVLYPSPDARKTDDNATNREFQSRAGFNGKAKGCVREDPRDARYSVFRDERNVTRLDALVELVDLFPTIAELAGYPIAECSNPKTHCPGGVSSGSSSPANLCGQGTSLLPLIRAAMENEVTEWKNMAFSQYPRPGLEPRTNSDEPRLREITVMGYSLRTFRYRYTAWLPFVQETMKPDWRNVLAEELYDHTMDPGENTNLAANPELCEVRDELRKLLREGWRKSRREVKGTRVRRSGH